MKHIKPKVTDDAKGSLLFVLFKVLKGDIQPAIELHEMLYQVMQKHNFLPEVGVFRKIFISPVIMGISRPLDSLCCILEQDTLSAV